MDIKKDTKEWNLNREQRAYLNQISEELNLFKTMKRPDETKTEIEDLKFEIFQCNAGSTEWLRIFHRITALKWVLGEKNVLE